MQKLSQNMHWALQTVVTVHSGNATAALNEVYTELVSLMLSGYDIGTSRFRLVRSEHYISTAWYF